MADATQLYSLLIPVNGYPLLLPNVAMAELVNYGDFRPEPQETSPWLLGQFNWRGIQVPMISFEAANGAGYTPPSSEGHVAIMNSLNGNPNTPFIALPVEGIPRLLRVLDGELKHSSRQVGPVAKAEVMLQGEPATIPDLDALERLAQQ